MHVVEGDVEIPWLLRFGVAADESSGKLGVFGHESGQVNWLLDDGVVGQQRQWSRHKGLRLFALPPTFPKAKPHVLRERNSEILIEAALQWQVLFPLPQVPLRVRRAQLASAKDRTNRSRSRSSRRTSSTSSTQHQRRSKNQGSTGLRSGTPAATLTLPTIPVA